MFKGEEVVELRYQAPEVIKIPDPVTNAPPFFMSSKRFRFVTHQEKPPSILQCKCETFYLGVAAL